MSPTGREPEQLVVRFHRFYKYMECLAWDPRSKSLRPLYNRKARGRMEESDWSIMLALSAGHNPQVVPVEPALGNLLENTPAEKWPVFLLANGKQAQCGGVLPVEIRFHQSVHDLDVLPYLMPMVRLPGETDWHPAPLSRIFSPDDDDFDLLREGDFFDDSLFDEDEQANRWNPKSRQTDRETFFRLDFPRMSSTLRDCLNTPLEIEDLVKHRDELMRLGVAESSDIPRPFTAGPALLISLYPGDEEGAAIVEGTLEIAYAHNAQDLKPAAIEPAEPSGQTPEGSVPLPGPEFCCFPPTKGGYHNQYLRGSSYEEDDHGRIARRTPAREYQLLKDPLPLKYKASTGSFSLGPRKIREFLETTWPELKRRGILIRIHPALMYVFETVLRSIFVIENPGPRRDYFSGRIEIRGLNAKNRALVLKAARERKQFLRLKNGAWIRMESLGLDSILKNLEALGLALRRDGTVGRMGRGEIAALAQESEKMLEARGNAHLAEFIARLRQPEIISESSKVSLNTGPDFRGTLRDYQKEGALFLAGLYELGVGGILADDMGLGKTIQSLAFVEHLRSTIRKREPCLLVAPVAALNVWAREAEKFFPSLPVVVWHGNNRHSIKMPADGILLTSFGVLNRDIEVLKAPKFRVLLVDEAQFAKNHRSRIYGNLQALNSNATYCLTGTPLENNIMEFRNLMELCFPGLLGKRESFRRSFAGGGNLATLRRRVAPFLLRRTKEMVLKELPTRTENSIGIPMLEAQAAVYEQARREAVRELENASRDYLMKMLPHLMRLRRIACHPRLDKSKDPSASGKFQHLTAVLPELLTSATGVLMFSQFTDVLTTAENMLKKAGIEYFRLDGSTSAKKRTKFVSQFQAGERQCFLISLKAGGTALTLHRADTVIHLDPWWNPAAERQASDRVHRIGQKRPVFIYRLYSSGSVEERVLEMQRDKRRLFNDLMGDDDSGKRPPISREQLLELLESHKPG